MKIISTIAIVIAFVAGFAAGLPVGRSVGFEAGSEWALLQADILAREAGVFMPVYLEDGNFRVVMKQPRGLYKRAWQLADRHFDQACENIEAEQLEARDGQSGPNAEGGVTISRKF
jgi:hypothetical protein